MNIFLYDNFLNEKKYDSLMARIETRITDLGLNGKIIRLSMMNSVENAIDNEVRRGASAIIAIGGDSLFLETVNSLAHAAAANPNLKNIPAAYIPISRNEGFIADFLGLPEDVAACDSLSARRIKEYGLGKANTSFFLAKASIACQSTRVEIDQNFVIESLTDGQIEIRNEIIPISTNSEHKMREEASTLKLYISSKSKKQPLRLHSGIAQESIFSFNHLKISNNAHAKLILDNALSIPLPAEIGLSNSKVKIIVGKGRL